MLIKRYDCYYDAFGDEFCPTAWDVWIRWLVLALVIVAAVAIFFIITCVAARRQRAMGQQSLLGNRWGFGQTAAGHGQPMYNQQPQFESQGPYYNDSFNPAPPPAYTPPPNNGYYQRGDMELQPPQQAYGGAGSNGNVYGPPKAQLSAQR